MLKLRYLSLGVDVHLNQSGEIMNFLNSITEMAKPIKETPFLTGKDAKKFLERMKYAQANKASEEEKKRIRNNFAKLDAIAPK